MKILTQQGTGHTRGRTKLRWPKLPLGEREAVWLSRLFFLAGPLVSYSLVEVLN